MFEEGLKAVHDAQAKHPNGTGRVARDVIEPPDWPLTRSSGCRDREAAVRSSPRRSLPGSWSRWWSQDWCQSQRGQGKLGGPGSCATFKVKQRIVARCGRKSPFGAQKGFSAAPAPDKPRPQDCSAAHGWSSKRQKYWLLAHNKRHKRPQLKPVFSNPPKLDERVSYAA
jgi:hypothetical protein